MNLCFSSITAMVCAISLFGCATFTRGSYQRIELLSEPPGATILILPSGKRIETPASLELRRDRALTLIVEKDGYRALRVFVDTELDAWAMLPYSGNLIFGGVVGMSRDHRSGALFHLVAYPERYCPGIGTRISDARRARSRNLERL